jgi:LEA14-like dessication related protein
MKIIRPLALVISLFMLTGCSLFITAPSVQVKDVGIVGLDSNGVEIELLLAVTNPNPYRVKLTGYNYDLKVMALPLAKGGGRETLDFQGGGTVTDLRLPVRVSLSTLYELLKRRPDPDNIPYTLDAGLELDSPLGVHAIPVEKRGTFKVPERYRPEFFLKQLRNIVSQFSE